MIYLQTMAFNKQSFSSNRGSNRSDRSGGRGGFRPRFGGRGDRGPVEMHDAICDNCGKSCQVPFRPTQGKPVYCSSCFENRAGSMESRDSRKFEGEPRFGGEEGRAPQRESRPSFEQPNYSAQFETLNSKLDTILNLLSPITEEATEKVSGETTEPAKKAKLSKKTEDKTESIVE